MKGHASLFTPPTLDLVENQWQGINPWNDEATYKHNFLSTGKEESVHDIAINDRDQFHIILEVSPGSL